MADVQNGSFNEAAAGAPGGGRPPLRGGGDRGPGYNERPIIPKRLRKAGAFVVEGDSDDDELLAEDLKVRICEKCRNAMAKFGYCKCVLGLGWGCAPCHKGKKTCVFDDHLFAKHPELRRALWDWKQFCDRSYADGDTHITWKGTYGTISGAPTKGTHYKFSDRFHQLRRRFEDLLDAAQQETVPATPYRTSAQLLHDSPRSGDGIAGQDMGALMVFPNTPSRGRNAAQNAGVVQLAGATQSAFREVALQRQHDANMLSRRLDWMEQIQERSSDRIADALNNLAWVIAPAGPVRHRRQGHRSAPYDRRGGEASGSLGAPWMSGALPARSRRLDQDLRAVQRSPLNELSDLEYENPYYGSEDDDAEV